MQEKAGRFVVPLLLALIFALAFVFCAGQRAYADDSLGDLQNVQITSDGIISWDPYEGAADYKVTFIDEYYSMHFTETVNDLCARMKSAGFASGDYRLRVVALNEHDVEISNPVELTYYGYYHPSLAQATNLRWDGSTAKWDPVDHASYYVIYVMRKGQPGYADSLEYYDSVSGTSFSCAKIITDTEKQYYFYVYASSATNEYASSKSEDSPLTYGIAFPYRDITNLRLTNGVLTWDAYSGASEYVIDIEFMPHNFFGEHIYDETSIDLKALFKHQNLPSGDYPYTIYAQDDEGFRISNVMSGTYVGFSNESLSDPVNLRWDGKVAKWDAVDHADGYTVILYKNNVHVDTVSVNTTECDFSGYIVSTASTYTFKVKATDSTDNYASSQWVESAPAGFIYGLTATVSPSEFAYDGAEHKPAVIVQDADGNVLTAGTDYELTYPEDCISVGTKQITITGKSPYTGSMTVEYVIRGGNIADANVTNIRDKTYTGSAYLPVPIVRHSGSTLTDGTDYTFVIQNSQGQAVVPLDAGTYRVVITGMGSFTGTKRVSFMITPIDVAAADVSGVEESYQYNGSEIKPVPIVKAIVGGVEQTLIEYLDYVLSYANNINAGTATVTVIGQGNFTGEAAKTFTIKRKGCNVKSLWASQHDVGKVLFKWTKESSFNPAGWQVKFRTKKIGSGSWSGWTEKFFSKDTYQYWCTVPVNYVVEIHAKSKGDSTYSTGIITTPAGGKYQAMKTVYVKDVAKNVRVDSVTLKVGKSVKLKPDYEYPVKDYKKRPKLYPTQALWDLDAAGKSMLTITKPDGSVYAGGMIDGVATIKGENVGTTNLICRAPNGRTKVIKVTVTA